jgi:anti-sigma B factor antagonist
MDTAEPHLDLTTTEGPDGVTIVAARGEVDAATSEQLGEAITKAAAGGGPVSVDLSGVSFIDSSGLRCLIVAQRDLGDRVVVVAASDVVVRLFEVTGLTETLMPSAR